MQRYSLIAFSFLLLSTVLVIWLGLLGPTNATTWKEWQPLLAATVALGGASLVYRGATLAYAAAMAKVKLDEELNRKSRVRQDLGVFLRLDFALNVLRHEADVIAESVPLSARGTKVDVVGKRIRIKEPDALIESWNNLQAFPPSISERLADIRGILYDFANYESVLAEGAWEITAYMPAPSELKQVHHTAIKLAKQAKDTREALQPAIRYLRRYS